jgi:hypothetical protein
MAENQIDLKFVADTSQLDKFIRSTKTAENQIKRLAAAEAQGKITTQQYDKAVQGVAKQMQSLAKGNIAAWNATNKYSKSVLEAARNNKAFAASANAATTATVKQGAAVQQVSKKLNQKSMILQQTGLQLGDLVVQVQSGTSFLLAFGQQATQLIGTFSLLARSARMIAIFAGLGVIVPIATAIAGTFLRMGDSAKTAADKVSGLKNSLNALKNVQSARMASPTEMFEKFGAGAEEARKNLDIQLQIELSRSKQQITSSFGSVRDFAGGFVSEIVESRKQQQPTQVGKQEVKTFLPGAREAEEVKLTKIALEALEAQFGVTVEQAKVLSELLVKVFTAQNFDEQKNAGAALRDALQEAGANYDKIGAAQQESLRMFFNNSNAFIEYERIRKDLADKTIEREEEIRRKKEAALRIEEQQAKSEAEAEAAKASFKSEQISLARKKELLELEIQHGKESTQVREKIQEFERQDFQARLKALGLNQEQVRVLVEQKEETQGLANQSERLADAAERTEKALSSLRGFGASVSAQLSKVRAEVEALETGQDPGIAGRMASLRASYLAETQKALAAGLGGFEGEGLGGSSLLELQQLEAELKKLAALREKLKPKRREARKLGPAGPKLMEDSVKEFLGSLVWTLPKGTLRSSQGWKSKSGLLERYLRSGASYRSPLKMALFPS